MSGVVIRNERRIRLVFTNVVASTAYGPTGGSPLPAYYTVTNQDGLGGSPNVVAALVVPGSNTNVELALDGDLVEGALYQISAVGVPAIDASVSTVASTTLARYGAALTTQLNVESKREDTEELLYGKDIVWTGDDFLEDANGDLYQLSGSNVVRLDIERRLLLEGLPWDPNYGAGARQFVDSPGPAVGNLRGRLEEQTLRDDRVKSVSVQLVFNDATPDTANFEVDLTLTGGHRPAPVGISVKV